MFNQDWHPENLKQLALELGYQTNAYYDEFESLNPRQQYLAPPVAVGLREALRNLGIDV